MGKGRYMNDNEFHKWMSGHSRRLDKKYYSRGMTTLILHKRAVSSAFFVVEDIRNIELSDIALTAYFMIKDKQLSELARDYERMLELAKIDADRFVESIYEFYVITASKIKKNGLYKQFFEMLSILVNTDHSELDSTTTHVYNAYTNLLLDQHEYLRNNKFETNKIIAGVDSKGNVIEIDDAYPSLDYPLTEIEHDMLIGEQIDIEKALKKYYAKYGYTINSSTESIALGHMCRAYTNTVLSMTPYINEYTVDVLPRAGFDPVISKYLNLIPIPTGDPDFRNMLKHRRRTLPTNGVKVHFENSLLYHDMLLKEVYHEDAVICLFRIESEPGEISGFYNTQTGQFSSPFHMNVENKFHFGMSVERLFLWAYAAYSTDKMLPTTESYRKNLLDPYAEVSFTSIPGKLRVPVNCRHIRSIAGKDAYETTIKHINGYIRKLPEGQTASEKAVAIAESLGYSLAPDETYVCPFERTAWITRIKK